MSLGTARDQVRVARRLEELPELAAAFENGRVSYSKVRAITRVADPADGVDWVDLARHYSAAQLDKIVRGVRRAQANEEAEADPEQASWRLRTRTRYDDRGNFVLTVSGPADLLPVVRAGLDAKKTELRRARDVAAQAKAQAEAQSDGTTEVTVKDEAAAPSAGDASAGRPQAAGPRTRTDPGGETCRGRARSRRGGPRLAGRHLSLPRLHSPSKASRPPCRLLERRWHDRPGEPRLGLQPAPHPHSRAGLPTRAARRPPARGPHSRRRSIAAPPGSALGRPRRPGHRLWTTRFRGNAPARPHLRPARPRLRRQRSDGSRVMTCAHDAADRIGR